MILSVTDNSSGSAHLHEAFSCVCLVYSQRDGWFPRVSIPREEVRKKDWCLLRSGLSSDAGLLLHSLFIQCELIKLARTQGDGNKPYSLMGGMCGNKGSHQSPPSRHKLCMFFPYAKCIHSLLGLLKAVAIPCQP